MSWRGLVVALLLVVVGGLAGAGGAYLLRSYPEVVDTTRPVSATSPSFPTDPPVQVLPDPRTPALEVGLRTHRVRVGQDPFGLELPVPNGWDRSNPKAGEWRWFVEENPLNTYVLRVVLPSGYATIGSSLESRIEALEGATGIQEFTVESRTADTFVATYVSQGHRRLTMERFVSLDGSDTTYANFALVGRLVDRDGMSDLLETITEGAER